jgi:hypothetical protein
MRKCFIALAFTFIILNGFIVYKPTILADAALPQNLSIVQMKITGDEFLVLRNTTPQNLSLSNFWLQYFNDFSLSTPGISSSTA